MNDDSLSHGEPVRLCQSMTEDKANRAKKTENKTNRAKHDRGQNEKGKAFIRLGVNDVFLHKMPSNSGIFLQFSVT